MHLARRLCARSAIASGQVARGPTGDGRRKPDLVAPGEKIDGPLPNGGIGTGDGTSLGALHVSGAAAIRATTR